MPYLEIHDLTVSYEKNKPALKRFSLNVEQGELLSLLGPSGCGKTTTLRSVAGFIQPDAGQIVINNRDYTRLPPNQRDIGLVFQSYALFSASDGLLQCRLWPADAAHSQGRGL